MNIIIFIKKHLEKYLESVKSPVINIPVIYIKEMCIHTDKKDEKTNKRSESSDLLFPIIISKNTDGEYSMILDGHHRLKKAIDRNEEYIKARILDLKNAPREYKIMFG